MGSLPPIRDVTAPPGSDKQAQFNQFHGLLIRKIRLMIC